MRPADLRTLLELPFTDEQLDAACGPLEPGLIVAGAGSGKTSVMAARVVWLVGTGQVQPDQVLGLTFTNKAAAELSSRITGGLAKAGLQGDGADDAGSPVVSTYHAFAGRLVTEHGLRLGVEPRSRLLADATRFQLAARVLRAYRGPVVHLTRPLSWLIGELVSLDGELSEHLVSPTDLRIFDERWIEVVEQACARDGELKGHSGHCASLQKYADIARQRIELSRLVEAYRAAKAELDAIDFGDQVAWAARLAETVPEVGVLLRGTARVVLLDEYQDTSVAQRRMLVGLFGQGHAVTAVGDPCQAIYGWRGASVSNLDAFPEHFPLRDGRPAPTRSLSVNQRSGGRLLQLANRVAAVLRDRHVVVELTAPPAKRELGQVVVGLHLSWEQEVRWVAQQVQAQVAAGTPPGQCAVLVRARRDFGDLHAALVEVGLPVEVVGLGGLLALPEVADVVAVLEVVDEPTANAALLRLLTGPRWRIGVRDLAQLGRRGKELLAPPVAGPHAGDPNDGRSGTFSSGASSSGLSSGPLSSGSLSSGLSSPGALSSGSSSSETDLDVDDTALEEAVAGVDPCDVVSLADVLDRPGHRGWSLPGLQRLTALGAELRELRAHRDEPLLDLVHRVVDVTGLDVELSASPQAVAARRRESLSAFLDVAAGFADLDGQSSLTGFLAFLRAAQEHERGLDSTTPSGSDAVQLLTAHKAKGLEWDVVACPDLTRTVFPSETLRGRWTAAASVLPGPLRGDATDQPSLDELLTKAAVQSYDEAGRDHLAREERRLGYVAFTRARRVVIGSGHWWGPTQKRRRGPSPFLRDLRDHVEHTGGEIACWEAEPEQDSNPQLLDRTELAWPTAFAPEPLHLRTVAAEAVRADLLCLADGGSLGEDEGLTADERQELERLDREAVLLLDEEREARRAVREVVLPTALTASQLLRLQADPDGFARDLARPLPRPPAPAARRGTRFHAWVEGLFDERPLLDPADLPGAEDDERGTDDELAALQTAFLATPWAGRRPHAVEAEFALPVAGRVVRGRIDAVYDLGGGRWKVVDWKTGRETADPLQLAVYRLAWARLAGVDLSSVEASFLYVRTGREDVHPDLPGEPELVRLLTGPGEAEPLTLL